MSHESRNWKLGEGSKLAIVCVFFFDKVNCAIVVYQLFRKLFLNNQTIFLVFVDLFMLG